MKVPVLSVRMSKRYRMPRLQGMLFNKAADSLTAFLTECGAELSTMKRY